jgi:hypothetical protein
MNSNVFWFLLLVTSVTAVIAWKKAALGLPSVIAIVLLFSAVEVATNYPMIWRDVYLHGSAVKGILDIGHIANTWDAYAATYPGFFLLWSTISLVTGIQLFPSNLLLLLPVVVVLLAIILVLVYRRLSVSLSTGAALLAFLLMNFNQNEFTFIHFNTRLLSLVFVLLFILLFLNKTGGAARIVGLIVVYGALVISHVLNSLVPVVFLAVYWLFERKRQHSEPFLVLSCASIYVAWNAYFGFPLLKQAFMNFANINLSLETAVGYSPAVVGNSKPLFGTLLGDYYKVFLVILMLISIYSIIKLRSQQRTRILSYYLLSILFIYGVTFFSLRDISVNRGIVFASLSLAALPLILLTSSKRIDLDLLKHKTRVRAIIVLIVLLAIPQFMFVHELPLARYGSVESIDATSRFLVSYRNGQSLVSLGDFPIYYCFYEPFYKGYNNLGFSGWKSLANITDFLLAGQKDASLRIVSYNQIVDWGCILGHADSYNESSRQWNAEVYGKLGACFNRIYDNGFGTIFG